MSFNGDLYPTAGADVVMTTKGDVVRFDSERERYGIGSTNQILQVKSGLPSWETLSTAGSVLTTQGDVLYEGAAGLARLGFGTSGDVLTTKGTGANPVWETPSAGAWELLDSYDSSGANSSYTYTPSPTLNPTNYSLWCFTFQGDVTSTLALRMRLNNDLSTNQHWMTEDYDSGVITVSENMGEAYLSLASTVVGASAIRLYGYIYSNPNAIVGGEGYVQYNSFAQSMGDLIWERHYGVDSAISTGIISQVDIETSTSTWTDGSMFRFYGQKTA